MAGVSAASQPHIGPDARTLYDNVRIALVDDEGECTVCGHQVRDGHRLDCAFPNSLAALESLFEQLEALRTLVVQHHAAGVLSTVLVGDECPVCKGSSVDLNPASEPKEENA